MRNPVGRWLVVMLGLTAVTTLLASCQRAGKEHGGAGTTQEHGGTTATQEHGGTTATKEHGGVKK